MVGQGLGLRGRLGVRPRDVIPVVVMVAAGAVVMMPVLVVAVVTVGVRSQVRVEVRAVVVSGGLGLAVAMTQPGPLRQQDGRHQEQAHDAIHGVSFIDR